MLETNLNNIIKRYELDKLKIEPTDNYYDHTTFSVRSLSEYVELIQAFTSLNKKTPYLELFYRGMADYRWELVPSLVRRSSELKYGYTLEHDLAVEFSSEMPSLFQNASSNFERITKMQHFGVPTRLLDFSLNPLIALYFACSDKLRTPGRVVFTLNKLHHFDEQCVECISSLYLYDDCMNIKLDGWLGQYNMPVSRYLFDIYSDIHMKSPLFVKPLYLDERMRVQRSVFLLFHNYLRDGLADCYYYNYREINPERFKYEKLENIYHEQIESPRIGFSGSPFFAVDKHSFSLLTDSYRKIKDKDFFEGVEAAFAERFYLQDSIQPLENDDIWYNFSSIIIPSKYKKTILSQLECIGIDEAYVYPEAEYIAKRVNKHQR